MATFALIRDTFREAFARKIFWGLFGLSAAMILFFLFLLKIDLVEGGMATLSLFGRTANRVTDADLLVRRIYAGIATFLYTWGMFLSVFASAGLIPSVLEPGRIELLLSKPVSRTHIMLGRYLGNILVISCNVVFLVLGVWTIVGIKSGIWSSSFLISIATTIFIFAVMLAVVMLVGVLFESAALATMISIALMVISAILAQKDAALRLLSSEWSRQLWRGLYYVLPKIWDVGRITLNAIQERKFDDYAAVWSSALFAAIVLAGALRIFSRRDF